MRPLAIYLNDHLAASTGGARLARRARDAQADERGRTLTRIADEIEADKGELERTMDLLGVRRDPLKQAAAVAAEQLGRLKPNGRLLRRSPLSSLVELEGLAIAVQGKRCLWRALQQLDDPRLAAVDLPRLVARAEDQHDRIEHERQRLAGAVLR
ncbi:hypothetical protein [Patulibacter defluvii]|uniref:hypothetical protein n=1 Tax=Patulibacter defluvii TaxID=3095358 RepID=UPI002A75B479|nr:hypothetical protein [Patulibacter sp. DM4]